jgi:hypothetical protein
MPSKSESAGALHILCAVPAWRERLVAAHVVLRP